MMSNKHFSIKKRLLIMSVTSFALALAACSNNESSSEKKEESSPAPASVSSEVSSSSIIESSSIEESSEITSSEESISSLPPEETYNIVRPECPLTEDNMYVYEVSGAPSGVNMTYYTDIYSRGFSWITDTTAEETELYLVKSDKGAEANFNDGNKYYGEALEVTYQTSGKFVSKDNVLPSKTGSSNSSELKCLSHKVHIENLEPGKAYSYKIGCPDIYDDDNNEIGYAYGAFIVEKENVETITALHMSDAQTLDPSKLNVWRNTFTKAVDTAGKGLDMALYNGDQFDQNMEKINNVRPVRFTMYSKALDVIYDYKMDIPYMTSSGNHEPSSPYSQYLHSDIKYPEGGVAYDGCFYSYDYKFAHFTVLNTNDVSDAQISWLKDDLDSAINAKWKVVMLHISPYSTGDHTNKSANQNIVKKLTPVFSEKHVDLVLQAHDHTYNKTLPYKWDAAGYTTNYNDEDVVNLNPETETIGDVIYDKNPEGTYYVTTGAAGHRCGAPEAEDGIWAEVVKDGDEWKGADSNNTFLKNTYKIEMGTLKYATQLEPYTVGSIQVSQNYQVGDLATGCVNAQMFGVLNLSETTLSYNVYTVKLGSEPQIFDSLDILKA